MSSESNHTNGTSRPLFTFSSFHFLTRQDTNVGNMQYDVGVEAGKADTKKDRLNRDSEREGNVEIIQVRLHRVTSPVLIIIKKIARASFMVIWQRKYFRQVSLL